MNFKLATLSDLLVSAAVMLDIQNFSGETVHSEFTAKFRVLPDDEVAALVERGDKVLLDAVLVGWDGIDNEDGAPMTYSKENLATLTNWAFFRVQTITAYYQCLTTCARKNSLRPLPTG